MTVETVETIVTQDCTEISLINDRESYLNEIYQNIFISLEYTVSPDNVKLLDFTLLSCIILVTSPTFTRPLNDMARDINSHVKIGCSLNVEATVEWFKDTKRLKTATKEKKKEHWLTIKSMSVADCGKYLCRCESAVTSCNLTLRGKLTSSREYT